MMKNFLLATALISTLSVNAQQWNGNTNTTDPITRSGKVAIGTTNTPSNELEVNGTTETKSLHIQSDANYDGILLWTNPNGIGAETTIWQSNTNHNSGFNIYDDSKKARYSANIKTNDYGYIKLYDKNANESVELYSHNTLGNFIQLRQSNSKLAIGGAVWDPLVQDNKFFVKNGNALIDGNIVANENIGIGTNLFVDGSDTYRLSVNGKVRANSVKVYTDWADYVFEENYKLPTLKEVEKHIKQNGHLKDIPSAKEVEDNGIELGEMNKLLLQKIEELTLYIIDVNKKVELLNNKINTYENED